MDLTEEEMMLKKVMMQRIREKSLEVLFERKLGVRCSEKDSTEAQRLADAFLKEHGMDDLL